MLSIFEYSFMIRALIAGGVIAIIAPVIGTFLLTKRYSLLADTLSHVSLAGVALGFLLGISPLSTAVFVTVVAAIILEKLRHDQKIPGEAALAMFLSGGLALAVTLISATRGMNINVLSYLFGSIATVQLTDVLIITVLSGFVLLILASFYKELLYISFDEETATVSGLPVRLLNVMLMVLTAISVTVSMQIIGVLLVGALMVIPVITATQIARSFKQIIGYSVIFSVFSVLAGLFISYYLNLAAGGAIVLLALGIFVVVSIFKNK